MRIGNLFLYYIFLAFLCLEPFYSHGGDLSDRDYQKQTKEEIEKWLGSPVKYIITKEESKTFKKLENREDKIRFINYFWLRRDPNPKTVINEFKREFYKRVAASNQNFKAGKKEGWKSQRGQILIILGHPHNIRSGVNSDLKRYQVWTYHDIPSTKIPPNYMLTFIDYFGNGDYAIGDESFFSKSRHDYSMDRARITPGSGLMPPELTAAIDDINKKSIINRDLKFEDVTESVEFMLNLPFDFFLTSFRFNAEQTYLLLGLRFQYSDISFKEKKEKELYSSLDIEAFLFDKHNDVKDFFKQRVDFSIEPELLKKKSNESFFFWQGFKAIPGEYVLNVKVKDEFSGARSALEKELTITPLLKDELILSEIIVADEVIHSLDTNPGEGEVDVIWLMAHQITPNMEGVYRVGSKICIFFQLINLKYDHLSLRPQADIRCYITKDKKVLRTFRIPISDFIFRNPDEILVSFCIPLTDFNPDEYSLFVIAMDKIADRKISQRISFKIIEEEDDN
jgi:GWxTD domain-containing protein